MTYRIASAPARSVSRTLAAIAKTTAKSTAFTIALAIAVSSQGFAQQPAPAPAPAAKSKESKEKEKEKAAKKPAKPAPAPAEAQPPPASAGPPQPGQLPQLIYSPWTKFCSKDKGAGGKQICFTGRDARIESGAPVVAAVIVEPEGAEHKLLRVTLPLGASLPQGTRIIVDSNAPLSAPYIFCYQGGCFSDYDASTDLIAKLKAGQNLYVQALLIGNPQPATFPIPLNDFAKAYDGPPTDPKVFEEQQKKLQEELQKRADEARKKLENEQGSSGAQLPPAPSGTPAKTQ